jgi:hypothetical protein
MCLLFGKQLYPPRIIFFLWLLSNNKLLTRDNLEKRRKLDNVMCLFCNEKESVHHLFFDCVVARQAWLMVSEMAGFSLGGDYESIAKLWLCTKKFGVINTVSSAVCWALWKLRNATCFQDVAWRNMKQVWNLVLSMLRCCRRASEDGRWFRRRAHFSGEAGHEANADRTCP